MTPKPEARKRQRSTNNQPLTFSPFARTIAAISSNKKPNQEVYSNSPTSHPNSSVNIKNSDNYSSSDSEEEEFDGTVQVDFACLDPKPNDFHGVKVLLQMYLDNKQWDLTSFVDLILEQPTVGSVVKIEDDDDEGVYAFISALNFGRHIGQKCMVEVKDYIFKVCKDKDLVSKLNGLFGENVGKLGLIVSQRVVNLPPQLLPPLYDTLFDEIERAKKDEPTKELSESFWFENYLVISKMYERKSVGVGKGSKKGGEEAVIYIKPEDEIWMELCAWSFSFRLQVQQVSTDELKNYRLMGLVMCVEASKVRMFRQRLHLLIDESV